MVKYFKNPFAVSGDKATVPNDSQPSGDVSYADGWTEDYQKILGTDPDAKPIPRNKSNQLMYDVTENIQQYQQHGVPEFISTADNDGSPFPYTIDAIVRYNPGSGYKIYQSLAAANTTLPTDTTKWRVLDYVAGAIAYSNVAFEGTVANGDVVYWNNGTSQFTKAVANGTAAQNAIGIADVTNKRVLASGLVAGLLTGLTAGTLYYLSPSSPGVITATKPAVNVVSIGVTKSTTDIFVNINIIPNTTFVGAGVVMTATQSIPGVSAVTKINFDQGGTGLQYDTGGFWDATNKRFVATVSGFYEISCSLTANANLNTPPANAPLNTSSLYLVKNNSIIACMDTSCDNAKSEGLSGTLTVVAAANDFFEIFVEHGDAAAITIGTNNISTLNPQQSSHFQFKYLGS